MPRIVTPEVEKLEKQIETLKARLLKATDSANTARVAQRHAEEDARAARRELERLRKDTPAPPFQVAGTPTVQRRPECSESQSATSAPVALPGVMRVTRYE